MLPAFCFANGSAGLCSSASTWMRPRCRKASFYGSAECADGEEGLKATKAGRRRPDTSARDQKYTRKSLNCRLKYFYAKY